jgi:hypothetical protein
MTSLLPPGRPSFEAGQIVGTAQMFIPHCATKIFPFSSLALEKLAALRSSIDSVRQIGVQ